MKIRVQSSSYTAVYLLAGLGLASTLLYALGLTARYPLMVGLQHPLASWATLAGFVWPASLSLALLYTLLMGQYMLVLRLAITFQQDHGRIWIIVIIGIWLLASLVLLGTYPGESLDIFDYLFRGRMQVVLGVSPLATTPALFADQHFYQYVNWPTYVDTYGPLWEYASGAVAISVGLLVPSAPLAAYILAYRLLAIGLAGLCGGLVYMIVHRHNAQRAPAALLVWLWNPLLLTSTAIGAHNDILMLVAILCAVLFFQRRRWLLGLLALALAAHVKLTGLLLLPVLALWLVQRVGWWRAIRIGGVAAVVALALSWLLYAPLGGWATLPRMLSERVSLIANSTAFIGYWVLQTYAGWSEAAAWRVMTQAATWSFLGVAGIVLVRFWRRTAAQPGEPDDAVLWRCGIAVTMAFLLLGSFWFWPWYLLWVLALAALLPASRFTTTLLPACCLGAIWLYIATDLLLRRWRVATPISPLAGLSAASWVVLALSAIMLCALWRVLAVAAPLREGSQIVTWPRRLGERRAKRTE
ncbi:MAG: DUF2029 domain-containing protein [Roseiflexaceae bacterium]|nr:DUF2029 domain-containing protein [Roseiflexaceae bacterium]